MSAYKFLRECLCKFPSLEVIELEEISKEVKEEITRRHGGKEKMLATQRSREEQKREVREVRVYKMLSEIFTNCSPPMSPSPPPYHVLSQAQSAKDRSGLGSSPPTLSVTADRGGRRSRSKSPLAKSATLAVTAARGDRSRSPAGAAKSKSYPDRSRSRKSTKSSTPAVQRLVV